MVILLQPAKLPMRRFPHLLPEDAATWQTWLDHYGHLLTHFDYDIRVGLGRPASGDYPPEIRKMALDLSMRRIDAIGHTPGQIYIFEVTQAAGFTTIGQYFAYPILYAQSYNPILPLQAIIIAAEIQTDIVPVLEYYKIPTYLTNASQPAPDLLYGTISGSLRPKTP